jgi:type I restriction enzyme S subunit
LIGSIPCPVPTRPEQSAISGFLERETAKIDALIAEQERLLALIAEKRQAVISHAVTKGLNPDTPMKDSGVAWLGKVPVYWDVKALKHIVSTPITDGPHETPEFLDEGVPFVSAEAVSGGVINFEKIRGYISVEDHERYSQKYKPKLHDIYLVKSGATTGVTAMVETDTEFNIWSPLAAIRCDRSVANPYFVLSSLRSRNFQEGVALNWSFGTQQNIGMGVLGNLPMALPPLAEQEAIAQMIGDLVPGIEALGAEARRAIGLLKERRSALIAAAVTGQIDVH